MLGNAVLFRFHSCFHYIEVCTHIENRVGQSRKKRDACAVPYVTQSLHFFVPEDTHPTKLSSKHD